MSDWIVINGDVVKFDQSFGNRTVIAPPTTISGTGKATINKKKVCVLGDEKQVMIENVPYTTPSNSIPGSGVLTILALDTSQQAQKTLCGQPVILLGEKFKAQFVPTLPALMPPPASTPDPAIPSTGTGSFQASQQRVKAQ
ncbi:hypothetical protein A3218_05680 [Pseudomonas chlororaphis]|uniref:hypothetical protein n=1 Tax=Pseudomonas chlororaphis TaxID=587753 RepID=UPI000789DF12|nr:hypothetical protein [Pseudomonas chlororaphis]AMS13809.1 hypothetical protein A3218_05680 [Pseudomonas chlororaphis]